MKHFSDSVKYIGADDKEIDLFESQYAVPNGISYNSYVILDEKIAVMDTIDVHKTEEWYTNLERELGGRTPDYLVISHLEPDHAANILSFTKKYPSAALVGSAKTFAMLPQFFAVDDAVEKIAVKEGDALSLGSHELTFIMAPMVHWPEVMVEYEKSEQILFSADAFGKFGALDTEEDWACEARRYYFNIVGKYGPHVQLLLKKAAGILDQIKFICPLHGPVWRKDLMYFIDKYDHWSRYEPEEKGVMIAYASMYGNTEAAAQALASRLCEKGITNVWLYDVSNTHVSYLISETFRLSHVVLASVTYNLGIYPVMHNYLMDMKALNLQNRTFAIIENGSWAVKSGDLMQKFIDEELKNMTVLNERLSMASALHADKAGELDALADAIVESINQ